MATFSFWYSETYTNKGFFEADSEEQAQELLGKVQYGELGLEDLPSWGFKDKGYDFEAEPSTLEEI